MILTCCQPCFHLQFNLHLPFGLVPPVPAALLQVPGQFFGNDLGILVLVKVFEQLLGFAVNMARLNLLSQLGQVEVFLDRHFFLRKCLLKTIVNFAMGK